MHSVPPIPGISGQNRTAVTTHLAYHASVCLKCNAYDVILFYELVWSCLWCWVIYKMWLASNDVAHKEYHGPEKKGFAPLKWVEKCAAKKNCLSKHTRNKQSTKGILAGAFFGRTMEWRRWWLLWRKAPRGAPGAPTSNIVNLRKYRVSKMNSNDEWLVKRFSKA